MGLLKSLEAIVEEGKKMPGDYPPKGIWEEIKKKVRRRDGYKCKKCGDREQVLHVHHVIPLSQGGSNNQRNLITLCESCHCEIHPGKKAFLSSQKSNYSKSRRKKKLPTSLDVLDDMFNPFSWFFKW